MKNWGFRIYSLLLSIIAATASAAQFSPVPTEFETCGNHLRHLPFLKLKTTIARVEPELKENLKEALLRDRRWGLSGNELEPQSILKNRICGVATDHLRKLLSAAGLKTKQVLNDDLHFDHSAPNHTFLVAEVSGEEIIIDPTYQQFFNEIFYELPPKYRINVAEFYPKEDILVLPYADLERFLEALEAARMQYHQAYFNAFGQILPEHSLYYSLSATESRFTAFMREVWDFRLPRFTEVAFK